ncbi:MAG: hypothetical protein CVT65_09115 [Actinobacteria bacterium HGW-Actinobacteria-5]|nr:MAG: hypothetical protein CVT65_09115 [Actinobacteria bacterium HGW-Actinobacteria-5]
MGEPGDRFRIVKDAELALLTNDTRQDPDAVDRMLHRDFIEVGPSGRLWTRAETLSALRSEAARESPVTDEWLFGGDLCRPHSGDLPTQDECRTEQALPDLGPRRRPAPDQVPPGDRHPPAAP